MTERNTTAGVLFENGCFLVAKRKKGGPLSEKWEFIGGKNRYGESLEETLKREWLEETGLIVDVGTFLLNTTFVNNDTLYTLHCFRVERIGGKDPSLNVHEAFLWADRETLSSLSFAPSDCVIRDYLLSCDL